ncbi:MAG: SMC-Scp complex subunit ScpB [Deltaproteobacteria bacterium]|nr:SMC-Scp complex subunit ScpB [Deltaproteobacteria bacterium]
MDKNTELEAEEEAPKADQSAETEESTEAFDEEKLLELAAKEGLLDLGEENADAENDEEGERKCQLSEEDRNFITAGMETVLFMSDRPVTLSRLRSVINREIPMSEFRKAMLSLREEFARDHRGVEIVEFGHGFQLRTKPLMGAVLRKMIKTQPLKLTPTSMETLAVIAYKQPLTKDGIDRVRGVDSGYMLRNLMEKRMIRIAGRSELPGRPMLYSTSREFLELFNLKSVADMPPLHEIESMVAESEIGDVNEEEQALRDFTTLVIQNDKVLFEEGGLDTQIEELRKEIAAIPTSTDFIEQQKQREKLEAQLAALATADAGAKAAEQIAAMQQGNLVASSNQDAAVLSSDAAEESAASRACTESALARVPL